MITIVSMGLVGRVLYHWWCCHTYRYKTRSLLTMV